MPTSTDTPESTQAETAARRNPYVSVITPAYNEEKNLRLLYERLREVLENEEIEWEWIVVDDHSTDDTFGVISKLSKEDTRIKVLRFSRNFGAHTALMCGLHCAGGDCATSIAGDLQDPPEIIPSLLEKWRCGNQVVWAARMGRTGEKRMTVGFSKLYYWLMRKVIGFEEMSATGADFFMIDRCVLDAISRFREAHVSILALITWLGFRHTTITYDKHARIHGESGWTFGKKLKLIIDSVISFSYLPIRLMSCLGFLVAFSGFAYSVYIIRNSFVGNPVEGWSSLMVVVFVLGGVQMLMMGMLGEYLWRALDEARQRPRYILENSCNMKLDKE